MFGFRDSDFRIGEANQPSGLNHCVGPVRMRYQAAICFCQVITVIYSLKVGRALQGECMTTLHDVPADLLIEDLAQRLADNDSINAPEWADFAKTGTHREKPPEQADWWYIRCGAVLRKVAIKGPIGTNHMSQLFGGPKDRGVKPNRAVAGSRKVARTILQQLASAGYITDSFNTAGTVTLGKVITPTGQSLLDESAHSVRPMAEERYPELARY